MAARVCRRLLGCSDIPSLSSFLLGVRMCARSISHVKALVRPLRGLIVRGGRIGAGYKRTQPALRQELLCQVAV
jgi:hypothetical protein